jgi:signal transduction histidine kinase
MYIMLSQPLSKLQQFVIRVYRSLYFPPTVIFIAIMIISVAGWHAAQVSLGQDINTAANGRTKAMTQSLRSEVAAYEKILRGGVGLFQGSDEVTRKDWSNYLLAFKVAADYPGVQTIGFAKITQASELAELAEYMQTQGVPDFHVTPASPARDTYALAIYSQAVASQIPPVLGFDMYSETDRRTATYAARDSGNTVLTGHIELKSADKSMPLTGFNMYTPYYDPSLPLHTTAERQAALRGYVYASFRTAVFFEKLTANADSASTGFRIAVAGDKSDATFYQSQHYTTVLAKAGAVKQDQALPLYGQTWRLTYVFTPKELVSPVQLERPRRILGAGVFISFMIATIVLLLLKGRARELATQNERAVELAKDELLSLASHQLRTPATGVKQYVGMILQGFAGDVPEEQKMLLERAYASNDRQLQIINEILHLAKIGSGRIVLARQVTDLNELITDIVREQQPDVEAAKHRITLRLPKRTIHLNIDAHMLRMAIENILSNAIKYTYKGGRITVKLSKEGRRVYVRITDTGIGIAASDQPELFKQFTRLPNEMSQQVEGTGIGLYLAKNLVELHGGNIVVESTPSKGSTFTIILPAEIVEQRY